MRVSLIQLLVLLDDLKVFKDEITSIEWKLIDWLDGSSISASTLLLGLIFFYINKEVFKNDKIEIATKIVNKFIAIWFIGFGGENTVNVQYVQTLKNDTNFVIQIFSIFYNNTEHSISKIITLIYDFISTCYSDHLLSR